MDQEPNPTFAFFAQRIESALNGPGVPLDYKCTLADAPKYIQAAKKFSDKPYCIVSDWQIWNLNGDDDEYMRIVRSGYAPSLIYAKSIVDDERRRAPPGYQIRSTLLVGMPYPGIFESMNTMYILVGKGVRKDVPFEVVEQIIFCT